MSPPAPGAGLPPCPASPNCVCSDDPTGGHHIEPLRLAVSPDRAWAALRSALEGTPRTIIVADDGARLRAECRSLIFRFVDDVEFALRADRREIAVRSASRLGWSDLGVNRRRVETLRALLRARGVVE